MKKKGWMTRGSDVLIKLVGIFLLLYAIACLVHGFYALQISVRQGRFGFNYDVSRSRGHQEFLITHVTEGFPAEKAGLKAGDKVISINGKKLAEIDLETIWGEEVAGSDIRMVVERDNNMHEIAMTRRLLPLMDRISRVLNNLIMPLLMLAYMLVGLWVLFRHLSFISKLIASVCFTFGGLLMISVDFTRAVSPVSKLVDILSIRGWVNIFSLVLAPAIWLLLFNNFPKKTRFCKKHKILSPLLIFLIPALGGLVITLMPENRPRFWVIVGYYGIMVAYIILGVVILSRGAKKETNVLKKRQYNLVLFGIKYGATAVIIGVSSMVLSDTLGYYLPGYFGWLNFFVFLVMQLFGLILPFTFLNSLMKNKILETESALRRRLRHIAASFALFLLYLMVAFFMGHWIISQFQLTDTSFIILVVLVLSLTFAPLQTWIMRWLDEQLYPERSKYKHSLSDLVRRMAGYIEESQILENLSRWLSDTMGITPIYVVSMDKVGALKLPLKVHSPRSVVARVRDGSSFFWDEIVDETQENWNIEEEEIQWAIRAGISITVPMISRGEPVGLLSIGKKKNNEDFTGDDMEIFKEAALHTAAALQNVKLRAQQLEKKRMDKELEVARNIQNNLLPRQIPEIDGLQLHGEYQPCYEVGGDYFDVIPMSRDKTALVVADVSGKGAGAALLMSNLQASLKMAISVDLPLREIVFKVNNMLYENSLSSQFITFFIGIWDNTVKTLHYINAGHNPPLVIRTDNRLKKLSPTGMALAIKPDQDFRSKEITLAVNDTLFIYTDGIEEFFNHRLEAFGNDRMTRLFKDYKGLHPRESIRELFLALKAFAEGEPGMHCDDLTIIAAKRVQ